MGNPQKYIGENINNITNESLDKQKIQKKKEREKNIKGL